MMNLKITCDHCGQDLTTTGNSIDYRILLKSERIPTSGGACTDMWVEPPVKGDRHFCGSGCLRSWLLGAS